MPRKSVALRLSQSQNLLAGYASAGLDESYQGRFISQSIARLENNKGLSKKQREWLDSLIDEGVPEPKGDTALVGRIDAAITDWTSNSDREWESNVLRDFKSRLNRGYELSGKQTALMEKLLKRAEDDASGANLFQPNEEQMADLQALVKIYGGYAAQWRNERPAVARAVNRVTAFLGGNATIEVYHYEKLCNSMGSKLRKFKNPRFEEGSLGWITIYNAADRSSVRHPATALTPVYISERGKLVNDWFVNGEVITTDQDQVGKRR